MRRRGRGGRRNDRRRRDHGRRTWVLPRREAPEPVRGGRGPARRRAHLGPDVARDDKLRPEGPPSAGHLGRRPGDLGPARQAAQRAGVCSARRQDKGPAARLLHHRQGGRGEEARLRRRQGALPARACGGRRGLPRQRRLLQGAAREGRAGLPSDARLLHGADAAVHDPAREGARASRAEVDRGVPPSGRLRRVQGAAAGAARQQRPRHYGRARVLEVRLPAAHRGPRGGRAAAGHHVDGRAHRGAPRRRDGGGLRHPGHPARLLGLLVPPAVRLPQLPRRGAHQPAPDERRGRALLWRPLLGRAAPQGRLHRPPGQARLRSHARARRPAPPVGTHGGGVGGAVRGH
mmetsp:Transcript_22137/g.72246  ORF Transcript_22137/g.72246 Transcript_22137/m.72246 type:complete len:347 (-) Transcript_22137:135-1175(-)